MQQRNTCYKSCGSFFGIKAQTIVIGPHPKIQYRFIILFYVPTGTRPVELMSRHVAASKWKSGSLKDKHLGLKNKESKQPLEDKDNAMSLQEPWIIFKAR